MVLPLSLLRSAQGHPMMVELKNGDTYNGHLVNCDAWMNLNLSDVVCTSREGDKFWRMQELYIRGNTIKYLRIPDDVMSLVKEEDAELKTARVRASRGRGRGRMGRGRGRGRGRMYGRGRGRGNRGRGRGGRGGSNRSNNNNNMNSKR